MGCAHCTATVTQVIVFSSFSRTVFYSCVITPKQVFNLANVDFTAGSNSIQIGLVWFGFDLRLFSFSHRKNTLGIFLHRATRILNSECTRYCLEFVKYWEKKQHPWILISYISEMQSFVKTLSVSCLKWWSDAACEQLFLEVAAPLPNNCFF